MAWSKNITETAVITNQNLRISYYLSDVDQELCCDLSIQVEGNGANSKQLSCKVQDAVDSGDLTAAQKTALVQASVALRDYLLTDDGFIDS